MQRGPMAIEPLDLVKTDDASATSQQRQKQQLSTYVTVMVALIATFIGVCPESEPTATMANSKRFIKNPTISVLSSFIAHAA
jgi:hypothetical protein